MLRRSVFKALTLAAGAAALAACTSDEEPTPRNTTAPGPSAPADGTETGAPAQSLPITQRDLSLNRGAERPLETKLFYPQSGGPYPFLLFSHGLTDSPENWSDLLGRWAQAGFFVAAPAYPFTSANSAAYNATDVPNQPLDAQQVITEVLKESADRIDRNRIAAGGHSAGAITTIGLFSKVRDTRLKAGLIIAGRQDFGFTPFSGPEAPLLYVQGKQDNTVKPTEAWGAYNNTPWPKAFMEVLEGGHVIEGAAYEAMANTTTDFWRWALYDDEAAKGRLQTDATEGNVATWASTL